MNVDQIRKYYNLVEEFDALSADYAKLHKSRDIVVHMTGLRTSRDEVPSSFELKSKIKAPVFLELIELRLRAIEAECDKHDIRLDWVYPLSATPKAKKGKAEVEDGGIDD